jgi:hypothetical protein
MSKTRAKDLTDLGDRLFEAKTNLDGLCQEIAEQIYPYRADFTGSYPDGVEYASHLDDSYPVLLHRELSNSISAMLRPRGKSWFRCTTLDEDMDADVSVSRYLEYVGKVMRSKLYDPRSKFIRATKEGDADYTAFGQCVISVEEAQNRDHLYLRSYHFRDCAWLENEIGEIDHLHRRDQMTARKMKLAFGEKNLHESIKRACEKEPNKEFPVRIIVMPAGEYDYSGGDKKSARGKSGKRLPFTVCYVDADNSKILREGGLPEFPYVVPRWQTISGSPYAFSPAAMTALPDARMAQQLARILLEAGEKAVDPPLIGVEEAVKEVNIAAGALSWIDYDYDEKLGEALRPLKIDGDMRTGFAMRQDLREMLAKAFYIDKLTLPEAGGDMTAYEVSRRLEEHVRNLLPIFEPIETEYNSRLLDKTFAVLRNMGAFDFSAMPDELSGADMTWSFESPLQEATARLLVTKGQETLTTIAQAKEVGFIKVDPVYGEKIVKDMVRGINGPATWRKSAEEEAEEADALAQQQEAQARLAGLANTVSTGAQIAEQVGNAAQSLRNGGLLKALPAPLPKPAPGPGVNPFAGNSEAA